VAERDVEREGSKGMWGAGLGRGGGRSPAVVGGVDAREGVCEEGVGGGAGCKAVEKTGGEERGRRRPGRRGCAAKRWRREKKERLVVWGKGGRAGVRGALGAVDTEGSGVAELVAEVRRPAETVPESRRAERAFVGERVRAEGRQPASCAAVASVYEIFTSKTGNF
jgi:hypothetical protein